MMAKASKLRVVTSIIGLFAFMMELKKLIKPRPIRVARAGVMNKALTVLGVSKDIEAGKGARSKKIMGR